MGSGLYRIFLAALVVVAHAGLDRFGVYDGFAVYSFFILSGFWITTIRRKQSLPYPVFLLSRVWRLWLPFLATALIAAAWFDRFEPAAFRFFDAAHRANPLLPQTWSLSFEVQFYALAPVLIAAFASLWLWPAVALIAATYLFLGTNLVGIACLIFFMIGVAGATYRWRPVNSVGLASAVALLVFALVGQLTLPLDDASQIGHMEIGYRLLFQVSLALVAAPFTFWTLTRESSEEDRALGDMAYTLYLVHHPIIMLLPYSLPVRLLLCAVAAAALWRLMWPSEWLRKMMVERWSRQAGGTLSTSSPRR